MATVELLAPPAKRPWQSKTMWVSLISTVLPVFFPPAALWVAANPALYATAMGLVFSGLRLISNGNVTFYD